MRELIKTPLIHSPEAMSVFGPGVAEEAMSTKWYMPQVREIIKGFELEKVARVYFEGYRGPTKLFLPYRDKDLIVDHLPLNELAKKRLPVILEHTEDTDLFTERFEAYAAIVQTHEEVQSGLGPEEDIPDEVWGKLVPILRRNYHRRETANDLTDRAIAQRIDLTLDPYETGFLFIGAEHNVEKYLPKDIKVKPLDPRLDEFCNEFIIPTIAMRQMIMEGADPANAEAVELFIHSYPQN